MISLNAVYAQNDQLFYWNNAAGEINMPGDDDSGVVTRLTNSRPSAGKSLNGILKKAASATNMWSPSKAVLVCCSLLCTTNMRSVTAAAFIPMAKMPLRKTR